MRHVTATLSPTNPSYVTTRQWPVPSINQLRTEAILENIAAHQAYLEKLQFESEHSKVMGYTWCKIEYMGEAAQVHHQLAAAAAAAAACSSSSRVFILGLRIWTEHEVQPQTAPLPRPVQPTPQSVPVKPAPARHQAQSSPCHGSSGHPYGGPVPLRGCNGKGSKKSLSRVEDNRPKIQATPRNLLVTHFSLFGLF